MAIKLMSTPTKPANQITTLGDLIEAVYDSTDDKNDASIAAADLLSRHVKVSGRRVIVQV